MLRLFIVTIVALIAVRAEQLYNEPDTLDIATFNIQVFGRTKMKKTYVADTLAKIILKYDVIAIQEIRDSTGSAIKKLLKKVNAKVENSKTYKMAISKRLGRTASKEQYAVFYRHDMVQLVDQYTYSDVKEVFQREPFMARFKSTSLAIDDFVIASIHTMPDDAQAEISHLVDVYDDIVSKWNISDVLIVGDYNADCTYIQDWSKVRLASDTRFYWLIDDTIDTTTKTTDCTYDRIVAAGTKMLKSVIPGSARAFHFDEEYKLTKEQMISVSDHYPVSIQIRSKAEMDDSTAYESFNIHDKSVSDFVRATSTKGLKYSLDLATRDFNVKTFYNDKNEASAMLATNKKILDHASLIASFKSLQRSNSEFRDIITDTQLIRMGRLMNNMNPLRMMSHGLGRYQSLYHFYKSIVYKYNGKIECVYGKRADCWIGVRREIPM